MNSLLLSALISLAPFHGERVYADAPCVLSDSSVCLTVDRGLNRLLFSTEARVALSKIPEGEGMAKSWWSLILCAESDSVEIALRHGNSNFGDILDRRFSKLTVSRCGATLFDEEVNGFATSSGAYNTLSASMDDAGSLTVSGGGRHRESLATIPLSPSFPLTGVSVRVYSGEGKVSLFCLETTGDPESQAVTDWTMETLTQYLSASTDPAEGFWRYLDRENDPEYARLGGRYTLATVRNQEGNYDIIYIEGAQTYAERWKPMMLKGALTPTIFIGHYDLKWTDASFEPIWEDIHADITDGAILTLSFPLLKTKIRFSKIPLKKTDS